VLCVLYKHCQKVKSHEGNGIRKTGRVRLPTVFNKRRYTDSAGRSCALCARKQEYKVVKLATFSSNLDMVSTETHGLLRTQSVRTVGNSGKDDRNEKRGPGKQ